MSAPSHSQSLSTTRELGGGTTGLPTKRSENGNVNQSSLGGSANADGPQTSSGVQQEVAGTLPNNFSLGATKADAKVPSDAGRSNETPNGPQGATTGGRGGDAMRVGLQSHEVEMPATKPHLAPQSNESSKPPSSKPSLPKDDV